MQTRRSFLVGAAAIAAGGRAAVALADGGEADLAVVRFTVASELLSIAFYERALAAKVFERTAQDALQRALANEREHYDALAAVIGTGAAQEGDFAYTLPRRAFDSARAAARLGAGLEQASLAARLGAVEALESADLRALLARIAACEARHLGFLAALEGGSAVGPSLPTPIGLEQASANLGRFVA